MAKETPKSTAKTKAKTTEKKGAGKDAGDKNKKGSVKETSKAKKPAAVKDVKTVSKAAAGKGAKAAPKAAAAKGVKSAAVKAPVKPVKSAPAGKGKTISLSKAKTAPAESKATVGTKPLSIREAMKSSKSIPMFKNPLLEKLSHVHPITPLVIYIPVILISIYYYFFGENSGLFSFLIFYVAGAFVWTISEYVLHRFVFHPPYSETHLKWFYFYVHGVHHEVPTDATRLVMPPGASIPLAIGTFFLFQALLPDGYLPFFAGFVSGYLVYDFLHFATHFFTFDWEWFKKIRKHHNVHHFNAPNKNFGVSNSLWDYIFSTKYRG